MSALEILLGLLSGRATRQDIGAADWTDLICVARATNLLGALAVRLQGLGVTAPDGPARHLNGALQLSQRQQRSVIWEAHCVGEALRPLQVPVLALKGSAYVLAGHSNAAGRLFGDIDLLVPKEAIGSAELKLRVAGWHSGKLESYDQRYYREWMHEIPPLVHFRRGTVIDLHHTILPPTAGRKTRPDLIIARSSAVPTLTSIRVPCVEDLLIHSLTHLVHEGQLDNVLRDLHDIHCLLVEHGCEEGFWPRLAAYAREQDLAGPVALGLHLVRSQYASPVPDDVLRELGLSPAHRRLGLIYRRAFASLWEARSQVTGAAAGLYLYVRSHALRMPPGQLTVHLARKAWMRQMAPAGANRDGA